MLIIGAGLAGACAAVAMARAGEAVTVVEAVGPAAGSSGAAAGLVNPLMARKANPTWRFEEALAALDAMLDAAGAEDTFTRSGVLRPALDAKQAGFFQRTAEAVPAHGTWWSAEETAEHVPEAVAPHGALRVRTGGALDVPAFCARLIEVSGAEIVRGKMTEWSTAGSGVRVSLADGRELTTDRLLLAHGDGAATHPALAGLSLHRILGETLRVRPPAGLKLEIPLSAGGYVVPTTEGHLLLGSTYRHDFGEVVPSEEGRQAVLAKTTRILPALRDAEIIGHRAGVRVTVPNIRLPMAGPLPDQPNVWLFTALGSKGALMAPLIAQDLPGWLADVDRIPESLRVR